MSSVFSTITASVVQIAASGSLGQMLDNLKTSFKLGHNMDLIEEKINVSTKEIVQSFCNTHKKLAINGINE